MTDPYYIFYQSAMVLSILASILVLILMWGHRQANGSKAMIAIAAGTFIWTLGFLLESHSDTLNTQLLFTKIGYMGSLSVPLAWLVFAVNYSGERKIIAGMRSVYLSIVPLVFFILILTNDLHHLVWYDEYLTTSGPFLITKKTYGIVFWFIIVYDYLAVIAGSIILVRRLFVGARLYTQQAILLIVAAALPLVWNVIYVFNLTSLPRKDLTPVMFAISGFIIAYGLMRLRLFAAVPFAREFLIRQLREGILVFDSKLKLLDVNPMAMRILGLDEGALGSASDIIARRLPVLKKILEPDFAGTEILLNVEDEDRIYEVETVPMNNKAGDNVGVLVMFRDVTERKEMQEQLIAQDRLVSIGELTSGVAHEINNPLAVIKGFIELLLKHDFPEDIRSDINIINSEVDRAAHIVSNLLTFSRKQPDIKVPVDINDIILKTLELRVYEQASINIRTVTDLQRDLPKVLGSEQQLRQVFLNIMINAEYFMNEAHGKGILTIRTTTSGKMVRVYCQDNGPGISPENLNRIFNPFYTTKDVGKGTGLGLSICHGIITEHGGTITVESTPGEGSTFIVDLPVYHSGTLTEKI